MNHRCENPQTFIEKKDFIIGYAGTHLEKNAMLSCSHCHGSVDRVIKLMVDNNPDKDPKKLINRFMKLLNV